MSTFYEMDFRVDTRDVDLTGFARPSAILGHLQEGATHAARALRVSRDETMAHYNAFWMVVRMWVNLFRPLENNENVTLRTWHRGGRGVTSYRDFDLFAGGGRVGEAVSAWVLADHDTFKLVRLDAIPGFQDTGGGALCKDVKLHRLKFPDLPCRTERVMGYSDTDINGHVNNTRYADFACDALHLEDRLDGAFISSFQLSYSHQCRAGETIFLDSAAGGDGACWVKGVGADGAERFDCMLQLSPLP